MSPCSGRQAEEDGRHDGPMTEASQQGTRRTLTDLLGELEFARLL